MGYRSASIYGSGNQPVVAARRLQVCCMEDESVEPPRGSKKTATRRPEHSQHKSVWRVHSSFEVPDPRLVVKPRGICLSSLSRIPANTHATNSQVLSSYHSQPWDRHSYRRPSPSPVPNPRGCLCLQLAARSASAHRVAAPGLRLRNSALSGQATPAGSVIQAPGRCLQDSSTWKRDALF